MIKEQFQIAGEQQINRQIVKRNFTIKVHAIEGSIHSRYQIWEKGECLGIQSSYPSFDDCLNPIKRGRASQ